MEYIIIILLLLILVTARHFLLVIEVQGTSMLPTFMIGERVLVCRYWFNTRFLKQKIVVFRPPTSRDVLFIKRLKALPHEHYTTHIPWKDETTTWVIPKGKVFVESDNKTSRGDSRSWGPIPKENLVGVVILRLTKKGSTSLNQKL